MLLPGLATELTGQQVREDLGWLMSVPNRHQLVWHIIDSDSVITALNGMASSRSYIATRLTGPSCSEKENPASLT